MLGKCYNSSSGKNNNVLAKTIVTINGLQNDSHPGGGEPGAPRGWSWPRGAGGGTPRGPRMGRARRSLLCTSGPGAFPAGRTCPGRGQAEGAAPARRAVPVPDFPASRVRPGPGPLAGARRPGTPGPAGTGARRHLPPPAAILFLFFFFWWPRRRGPGLAALRSGPMPRGPGSPASEGEGRSGAGSPGRGADRPPHCTDAETEAPRGRGCQDRPPGNWSTPHLGQRGGCFGAGVPRRRQQVSNPVGTGKYGATGLSTFQRAPRAAAGRSPAGLGLGGGAAGSGARVTAGAGGLTSRPAVAVAAGGDGGGVHSAPAARRIVCGEGPACARVSTGGPAPARPQGRLPARLQDLSGSKRQTELLGGDLVTRLVSLPPALYKFVVRSAELSG